MIPKRKHPRLNGWNYSQEGAYFLTLCSKEKKPIFSKIVGRGILDTPKTYRFLSRNDHRNQPPKTMSLRAATRRGTEGNACGAISSTAV